MIGPIRLYQPSQKGKVELWHVGVSHLWSFSSHRPNVPPRKPCNGVRRSPLGSHDVPGWSYCVPMAPRWRTWLARWGWRRAWLPSDSNATASRASEDWPMPGNTAYCLSKGGMRMLTRTAGVELAPDAAASARSRNGALPTPTLRGRGCPTPGGSLGVRRSGDNDTGEA